MTLALCDVESVFDAILQVNGVSMEVTLELVIPSLEAEAVNG